MHWPVIDFERLFRLRLVIARHGEMDASRWWNTEGVLGPRGAVVMKRGFHATHGFARARIVFEVAKSRCHELFDPPGCMTLWSLPADLEDQFQECWQGWLDDAGKWNPLFEALQPPPREGLLASLDTFGLLSPEQHAAVAKLKRSAENRAVAIAGVHAPSDDLITLLAAGFSRGEPGPVAIPYARLAE